MLSWTMHPTMAPALCGPHVINPTWVTGIIQLAHDPKLEPMFMVRLAADKGKHVYLRKSEAVPLFESMGIDPETIPVHTLQRKKV